MNIVQTRSQYTGLIRAASRTLCSQNGVIRNVTGIAHVSKEHFKQGNFRKTGYSALTLAS